MKAFFLAVIATCVITVGSDVVLDQIGFSAEAAATSATNVRLSD